MATKIRASNLHTDVTTLIQSLGGGADLYAANESSPSAQPSATGTNAIAIGDGAVSGGQNSLAFGLNTDATYSSAVAIGTSAQATFYNAIAIGTNANASGNIGLALGYGATASGAFSTAIGLNSGGSYSIAAGSSATALGGSRAFGTDSFAAAIANNTSSYGATGANSIAIGIKAKSTGIGSVAIGYGDQNGSPIASGDASFAIINGIATKSGSIAMGRFNTYGSPTASGLGAIAIGDGNTASATRSVALGNDITSSHIDAIVIGSGASSSAVDQITLGHTDQTVRISSTYTLPTTDGTNGQVLTTNGSGVSSWATASGGGGADLYAANESSPTAQPSATGANAIAIGDSAISSNTDSFAFGKSRASGVNSFAASINNNTTTYGANNASTNGISIGALSKTTNNRTTAVGEYAFATHSEGAAFGYLARATNNYSLALGARSVSSSTATVALSFESEASAYGSVAIGILSKSTASHSTAFASSRASGSHSFSAGITNNTTSYGASGANSVAIGYRATASGQHAYSMGRFSAASGAYGMAWGPTAMAIGQSSTAFYGSSCSASYSFGWGGDSQSLSGHDKSMVLGFGAQSRAKGSVHFGGHNPFDGNGLNQHGLFILGRATTDATATKLSTNTSSATSNNQILLPNNSCYGFTGTVIAREQASATNDFAVWEIKGGAVRGSSASTTALGTYNINKISESTGATNWSIALSADTTNGAVAITVTGEASHNIRWVATVNTTEVIY